MSAVASDGASYVASDGSNQVASTWDVPDMEAFMAAQGSFAPELAAAATASRDDPIDDGGVHQEVDRSRPRRPPTPSRGRGALHGDLETSHLLRPTAGHRDLSRPQPRRILVVHRHDGEAAEVFLGLDVRTVGEQRRAARRIDVEHRGIRVQAVGVDEHPGFVHLCPQRPDGLGLLAQLLVRVVGHPLVVEGDEVLGHVSSFDQTVGSGRSSRTSCEQRQATAILAAHSSASSREDTSTTANPPMTSLVSGYGPSVIVPSVATMLACWLSSPPPNTHAPASCAAKTTSCAASPTSAMSSSGIWSIAPLSNEIRYRVISSLLVPAAASGRRSSALRTPRPASDRPSPKKFSRQLIAAASQVGGLGGVARQLDGFGRTPRATPRSRPSRRSRSARVA